MTGKALDLDLAKSGAFLRNALGAVLGTLFTCLLFLTISHFERSAPPGPSLEMEDLRAVAPPPDAPPPPPVTEKEPPPPTVELGFEPGPSDSVVKIMATPPDLNLLVQPPPVAPPAIIQVGELYTQFRPKLSMAELEKKIYQPSEVDQLPSVLHHVIPELTREMREKAGTLRVTFLVVIDVDGAVKSIRVGKSSGFPEFDALMLQNIPLWTFSPAIRRGKHVRCIIEQAVHFSISRDTPFLLN